MERLFIDVSRVSDNVSLFNDSVKQKILLREVWVVIWSFLLHSLIIKRINFYEAKHIQSMLMNDFYDDNNSQKSLFAFVMRRILCLSLNALECLYVIFRIAPVRVVIREENLWPIFFYIFILLIFTSWKIYRAAGISSLILNSVTSFFISSCKL